MSNGSSSNQNSSASKDDQCEASESVRGDKELKPDPSKETDLQQKSLRNGEIDKPHLTNKSSQQENGKEIESAENEAKEQNGVDTEEGSIQNCEENAEGKQKDEDGVDASEKDTEPMEVSKYFRYESGLI